MSAPRQRKLGSLSSFGAFFTVPSTASSSKLQDARLMPPPPPGIQTKTKLQTQRSEEKSKPRAQIQVKGKGKGREVIVIDDEDEEADGMWTDVYGPTSEAELAPGKARISKLKSWLGEAIYGVPDGSASVSEASRDRIRKYKRILLLTGPAGTGKTTSVRLIAQQMGLEVLEWGEGVEESSLGWGFDRESSTAKFTTFLARHSYPSLPTSSTSSTSSSSAQPQKPRILLMTSLPNLSHYATKETFHQALLSFCKTYSSSSCPLVIVHSDAGMGGRAEESWMERDRGGREGAIEVVGKDVKDGPWCFELDFIPLANTFITKALSRVVQLAIPLPKNRPSASTLQLLAHTSNGDLRSAINSLQLLCKRSIGPGVKSGSKRKNREEDDEEEARTAKRTGKGSRGGKGAKLDVSRDLRLVLDAVTRREQSLGLFHALGKVFYNKRWSKRRTIQGGDTDPSINPGLNDPGEDEQDQEEISRVRKMVDPDPLPPSLGEHERHKSMIDMETFIPTIPVDASSFALWIHQSIYSFCNDIEEASMAADNICSADIMRTDDDFWQSSPQAIAYSLHLTIRGALMALPSPVPRNKQKVLKPQFFEAFRSERDNAQLLNTATGYMVTKGIAASTLLSERDFHEEGEAPWGGMLGKSALAGEMIPMMVKIQSASLRPLLPASVKGLSLPPWQMYSSQANGSEDELTAKDTLLEEDERDDAGQDGMGNVPSSQGWDMGEDYGEEKEELGWLDDDEIEDWD
ncbi:cell cycle checkpoint protein, partial [Tremellales sp. Uapishka_1]